LKTRKRFGQHFLHDPGVLKRIVEAVAPAAGEPLIEIGPGQGALTRPLLERIGHLTAIEIDRDLAANLAREFPPDRLTLVSADVLDFDFSVLPSGLRIVGNLPYNISTPILFHLAQFADRVRDMHFMLQKEIVQRMVAKHSTPDYGRLSVMLQTRFTMHKLFNVSPGAFTPPPKVDSAVVRLVPLQEKMKFDAEILEKVVREAFSARRKTLRNALPLEPRDYEELGIDPKLRPENLSPADYVRIALRTSSTNF
jgi:16S rRNA (adenine1518-N6/adenine1519-N6)-dimethyltransferase